MIQYELFLKEITNFLRSCSIKNKYFASNTAGRVMDKYGLSDLPDYFNPYYLHMCGISTLDLTIPTYLISDTGLKTINEDRKYQNIVGPIPSLTRAMMIRLENLSVSEKVINGISYIQKNLGHLFLDHIGYTNQDGSDFTGEILIWRLDAVDNKLVALESKIKNFIPDDDRVVSNIISGTLDWGELTTNNPIFVSALTIASKANISSITNPSVGLYVNSTSDQKTYQFNGTAWEVISPDTIFNRTVAYYKNKYSVTSDQLTCVVSESAPSIKCIVVSGALTWDEMYANGNGYANLQSYDTTIHNALYQGPIIDAEFSAINSKLGYSDTNPPKIGTRINFMRNARAWINNGVIIYSKNIAPVSGDSVFSDGDLSNQIEHVVFETTGSNQYLVLNDDDKTIYERSVKNDVSLEHTTYEFLGTEWREVLLQDLFKQEWKASFKTVFQEYAELSFVIMKTSSDNTEFSSKLILDTNNNLVLDEVTYSGWDSPIYVPSYDYKNSLTQDFTLYTRFFNRMKNEHVRTSLKYFIGSAAYKEVCENNISYLDYIRGVCYPVNSFTDTLDYFFITDESGTQVTAAYESDYFTYIANLSAALSNAINAENYSLLRYDASFLKENEVESIVAAIKKSLTNIRERWDVSEFGYEELYYSSIWAVIRTYLAYVVLAQRVKNLRTESVHIDHIWEFLGSRGLADYRNSMDTEQMLFLYKNIDYLRQNEGKQSNLEILSDKLLKKFGAEVRGKSILLDTANMKENTDVSNSTTGTHLINGLSESVSGSIALLSEDLDSRTAITSNISGRIESFADVYRREHNSGLEPTYGDTTNEQNQTIETAHNQIEVSKHSYAPTKLVEITRGSTSNDMASVIMDFIFQTLIRKLSSKTEILDSCVVNVVFPGLSDPKSFTIGEALALIFYAIRKADWYLGYNKQGSQNIKKNDIWKHITDSTIRLQLITNLKNYEDTPKENLSEDEQDYLDAFYIPNESFNDTIPCHGTVNLPYLGDYTSFNNGNSLPVSHILPKTTSGLTTLIGNPPIYIRGEKLKKSACKKNLLQIISPYEYSSLALQAWNNMCAAESTGDVPEKYDFVINGIRTERNTFEKVIGSNVNNGQGDGTLIGGIVNGSSRSENDKWYVEAIPYPEAIINSHEALITDLNDQASVMVSHFQIMRNSCDAYFHYGLSKIYKEIRVNDDVAVELVPGFKTFTEWFENDVELKSAFRAIESGSDQKALYQEVSDSLISALFPADKILVNGSIDLTKYNAMKKLFQSMGSYNIAYLDSSSVDYDYLYSQPITFNLYTAIGIASVIMPINTKTNWSSTGKHSGTIETWSTIQFSKSTGIGNWIMEMKSFVNPFDISYLPRFFEIASYGVTCNSATAILLYGSILNASKIPVFKEIETNDICNNISRNGKASVIWEITTTMIWTGTPDQSADSAITDNSSAIFSYLEETEEHGVICDTATAILIYGSVEAAQAIPHFRTVYVTNQ